MRITNWLVSGCMFLSLLMSPLAADAVTVTPRQALTIGVKIWHNESNGSVAELVTWSRGEPCASLGIAHFIWYPKGHGNGAGDSFPRFLNYLYRHHVKLPVWLRGERGWFNPWSNRQAFIAANYSFKMRQLRQLMVSTFDYQVAYMVESMQQMLVVILRNVMPADRLAIQSEVQQLTNTPQGVYVLTDYLNFKGAGIGWRAMYDGRGSGLLQVLEKMRAAPKSLKPIEAFVWAADQVLTQRVASKPPSSSEHVWLKGWRNRIYGYLKPPFVA